MKKSLLIILGLVVCVFAIQSFSVEKAPKAETAPTFKNLQVLPKDISKEDLDKVMKTFARSLDVKCGFCHAKSTDDPGKLDFASDQKIEKKIARGMIAMSIDINKNYFAKHEKSIPENFLANDSSDVKYLFSNITCYTCHHGDAHPATFPPMPKQKEN